MENSSDHLPVLIGVNLPINKVSCETTSRFIPTPQWFKATQEQLNHFHELLYWCVLLRSLQGRSRISLPLLNVSFNFLF